MLQPERSWLWPGVRVPIPPVLRGEARLTSIAILVGPLEPTDPPPREELYLGDLRALGGSDYRLRTFVQTHGPFAPPGRPLLPAEAVDWIRSEVESVMSVQSRAPKAPSPRWQSYPLAEVWAHVWALRDMTRIWHARTSGAGPTKKLASFAHVQGWWESAWRDVPSTPDEAFKFLIECLNVGVEPLRFRVSAPAESGCAGVESWLHTALCLQMMNDMAESTVYKECGYEQCRRKLFVHQRGRTKLGGHKESAMYCSYSCAQAAYRGRCEGHRTQEAIKR